MQSAGKKQQREVILRCEKEKQKMFLYNATIQHNKCPLIPLKPLKPSSQSLTFVNISCHMAGNKMQLKISGQLLTKW